MLECFRWHTVYVAHHRILSLLVTYGLCRGALVQGISPGSERPTEALAVTERLRAIATGREREQLRETVHVARRRILSLLVAYGLCKGACPWHLASERKAN